MSKELTPQQLKAAQLIAMGRTQTYAAHWNDVCVDTITRWKQNPEFIAEIGRLTQEYREAVRFKMDHLADACIDALWKEMEGGAKRADVAFRLIDMLGLESLLKGDKDKELPAAGETASLPAIAHPGAEAGEDKSGGNADG